MSAQRSIRRTKQGSIGILCCLLAGSLSLTLMVWVFSARARSTEQRTVAAVTAQINSVLARYDRTALSDYGILGFDKLQISLPCFERALGDCANTELISVQPLHSATSADYIRRQIINQMKPRLPLTAAEEINQRLRTVTVSLNQGSQATTFGARLRGAMQGAQSNLVQEALKLLLGKIQEMAEHELTAQIDAFCRNDAADLLGVTGERLDFQGAFLSPERLSHMADFFDRWLDLTTHPIYERLCLNEYVLGYLPSQVGVHRSESGAVSLYLNNGISINEAAKKRPCEAEMITLGVSDSTAARYAMRGLLFGLRSAVHLTHILTDEQQMQQIRTVTTSVCATILAVSGGTVAVDPESMAIALAIGKAAIQAGLDLYRLLAGQGVALWPEIPELKLWYRDYLRLMLLIPSEEQLAVRIGTLLEQRLEQPLFASLTASCQISGKVCTLQGGYQ